MFSRRPNEGNMDKNRLEQLLSSDENSFLDFKSEVDLESKRGKAKFLVEVLGLANSTEKPAYLILGVEDKTKKAIGVSKEITEERIQKVIADNCRPPLKCVFEYAAYKRKQIGVLTILGKKRPYFLKKESGFQDESGKQQAYSEKAVFVRRGSTGDTATIDEIIDMVLQQQESETTFESHDEIREELSDISSNLYHIDNSINRLISRRDRERIVEYLYLGIASGVIVGIFQALGLKWEVATFGIFLVSFWLNIFSSLLRLVRFGWVRSVIVSFVISSVFIGLSYLFDEKAIQSVLSIGNPIYFVPIFSGMKGMLSGVAMAWLGNGEYEVD
jgi:hypothetical protein